MRQQPLSEYRRKRDFGRTGEPAGAAAARAGHLYVVHKHGARRLHYDLRLEHEGVLLSWAVPKGPSLDPSERRLAVQVEDHPLEYGEFEGVIPEGEYGAGPSAVWDRGYWEPLDDVAEGLKKGRLHFRLHGEKLEGGWHLVRSGGRRTQGKDWLLIKERDAAADPERDIVAAAPASVKSGLTLEQLKEAPDLPVWRRESFQPSPALDTLPQARAAPLPADPAPQLATLVTAVPAGDQWLHEIKYDGYRMLARLERGQVRLLTRNGHDWAARFPAVAAALAGLPVDAAVLDGELVVVGPDGSTDFQALQNVLSGKGGGPLAYFLFDLLHLDGYDLTRLPLIERKALLRQLIATAAAPTPLRYSDHVQGHGETIYAEACRRGLEGVISKRLDGRYAPGRGRSWCKTKCQQRAEFVIGGFTEPQGSREGFGALLLGYYDAAGKLRYAGKVGTGFDQEALASLSAKLQRLERMTPPFAEPPGPSELKLARWVRPELVAEVAFGDWTGDGRLRHPSFQGLREDKRPQEVTRDLPEPAPPEAGGDRLAGVTLSHPERILWPEQGLSKRALAQFYADIADWILPHVVDRPLSLLRCPEGHDRECFFQRHLSEARLPAVDAVPIREKAKVADHVVIHDLAGLISLIQLGVLEIHPWGARAQAPERPDLMVFDLDPDPAVDWSAVCAAALEVRERLRGLGLESYLKVTGGKGLHVVAPLKPALDWDAHKAFTRALAESMARDAPRLYTANMSKAKRRGRIFVDYLRNGRGATAIAAYCTRARPGAPVAAPLRWEELDGLAGADLYTVANLRRRLAALRSDPWEGFFQQRQGVSAKAMRQLGLKG